MPYKKVRVDKVDIKADPGVSYRSRLAHRIISVSQHYLILLLASLVLLLQ